MTPFFAELIGTAILILLGNGVVANALYAKTKGKALSEGSGWIVITTGWAFAVYAGVVVAGPYSGAHLNPAVSVGLAAGGEFEWSLVPSYILAQMLGAMIGALLVWTMYKDHMDATEEVGLKRAAFYTFPEIRSNIPNLVSEILGTFILIYTIFYFTTPDFVTTGDTPLGMGALGAFPVAVIVWVIGLSLGGVTGYAINPARDWGPRIVYNLFQPAKNKIPSDWEYSWIPIAGPVLGALLAAGLYLVFS